MLSTNMSFTYATLDNRNTTAKADLCFTTMTVYICRAKNMTAYKRSLS